MIFKTDLSSSMRFDFINPRMDNLRKYFFATVRCLRGSNNMHRNGFELGYFWRLSDSSSSVLVALQFTCYFSLFTVRRKFTKINKTDRFAIKSLFAMFSLWKPYQTFSISVSSSYLSKQHKQSNSPQYICYSPYTKSVIIYNDCHHFSHYI